MKKALITGVNGQDGSFLADILIDRGYHVTGLVRHNSAHRRNNIRHLDRHDRFRLVSGDITDPMAMANLIYEGDFSYIYHEADQDNVGESFKTPSYTMEITVKAVTNLLEIIRQMHDDRPKLFLPSSATIFGNAPSPQKEDTPLNPQSPYAIGKAAVLHLGNLYRDIHGLEIVTGILYNHDSDRRNGSYLLHDICRIAIECSLRERKDTGDRFSNLEAPINVGEAEKYLQRVVQLMESNLSDNYVIGSPFVLSVREWLDLAFYHCGIDSSIYLRESTSPNRPGNPETYLPDTSKLESHLKITSIPTDASQLIASLVKKYRKEIQ